MKRAKDCIELTDLKIDCIVGIREREQRTSQPLIIDVKMWLPLAEPADSGDLNLTVNYAATSKQLAFVAEHGQWGLLESLAASLCRLLLLAPAATECRAPINVAEVRIRKPKALKGAAIPAVRMERAACSNGGANDADAACGSTVRSVKPGVLLDVLAETAGGAAYRLRLESNATWRLPTEVAAHVLAGCATLLGDGKVDDSTLREGDVLPRGSGATLRAGERGAAVLLVGPHAIAAHATGGGGGGGGGGSGAAAVCAYIALGGNLGHRALAITRALRLMGERCGTVTAVSQLYETAPQHVVEQPDFLNAACELRTHLPPDELLSALKAIERELGRTAGGVRYGPRPVDLDIALYGKLAATLDSPEGSLTVPHALMLQRTFVLAPLCDIGAAVRHPESGHSLWTHFRQLCAKELAADPKVRLPQRVLPVRQDVTWPLGQRTYVMGILNLTPDSFSDGGRGLDTDVSAAVAAAAAMVRTGADCLDLGAESTRPGAARISEEEEHRRLLPVVAAIRAARADGGSGSGTGGGARLPSDWGARVVLSVDTTRASVARAAIGAGADMINDISGGTFDEAMLPTAAELGVPAILMHTRGTPQTMASLARYGGGDAPGGSASAVTAAVCDELGGCVRRAHEAGLPPWWLVADPGIGFAKTPEQSMTLLAQLPAFVTRLVGSSWRSGSGSGGGGGACCASLVGASRKGFIGQVLAQPDAKKRQWGNAATVCAAVVAGCDIVRVHEVDEMRQVALLADAVHRSRPPLTLAPLAKL